jgi:hypothetical protein
MAMKENLRFSFCFVFILLFFVVVTKSYQLMEYARCRLTESLPSARRTVLIESLSQNLLYSRLRKPGSELVDKGTYDMIVILSWSVVRILFCKRFKAPQSQQQIHNLLQHRHFLGSVAVSVYRRVGWLNDRPKRNSGNTTT